MSFFVVVWVRTFGFCLTVTVLGAVGSGAASASVVFERAGRIAIAHDDGTSPRVIAMGCRPAISPNGKRVAFIRMTRQGCWGAIAVMPAAGGRARNLDRGTQTLDPSGTWSPNSRYFATGVGHVWDFRLHRSYRLHGGGIGGWEGSAAAFAPDSTRVLIQYWSIPDNTSLREARLGPFHPVSAGPRSTGDQLPAWGSRGFAFGESDGGRYQAQTHSAIVVTPSLRDPGREILRVDDSAETLQPVQWSKDGSRLLIAASSSGGPIRALIAEPDKQSVVTLPGTFDFDLPVPIHLSRDGTAVLGTQDGNVVEEGIDGTTKILLEHADHADWTR